MSVSSDFGSKALRTVVGSLLLTTALGASDASAQALRDALAQAYETNPFLSAERARLRATDEGVAQAKSGFRPRILGGADIGYTYTESSPSSQADGDTSPKGYQISLSQPIFEGFQTVNAVLAAEAAVREGRERLRRAEQDILLDAVTAYMDVIRDRAIIRLRQNNVRVLGRELRATQDRFSVGEVTRTDVSQARARSAESASDLALARANLQASRATYRQVVGTEPQQLRDPAVPRTRLPSRLQEAIEVALSENPLVTEASFAEAAARARVDEAYGEFLPTLELDATYAKRFDGSAAVDSSETTTITGRLNVPLYERGLVSSRVRERRQTVDQRYQEIEFARTRVRADVIAAWSAFVAAQAQLVSGQSEVEANRTALAGVREEERVGQRTLLDVLDAEQEFLDAQVSLAITQRDLIVAAYTVLEAMGRLTFDTLELQVEGYDSTEYYQLVESKYWGTTVEEDVYVSADPVPVFDTEVIYENSGDWRTSLQD